jgi:hypothetical protein
MISRKQPHLGEPRQDLLPELLWGGGGSRVLRPPPLQLGPGGGDGSAAAVAGGSVLAGLLDAARWAVAVGAAGDLGAAFLAGDGEGQLGLDGGALLRGSAGLSQGGEDALPGFARL